MKAGAALRSPTARRRRAIGGSESIARLQAAAAPRPGFAYTKSRLRQSGVARLLRLGEGGSDGSRKFVLCRFRKAAKPAVRARGQRSLSRYPMLGVVSLRK